MCYGGEPASAGDARARAFCARRQELEDGSLAFDIVFSVSRLHLTGNCAIARYNNFLHYTEIGGTLKLMTKEHNLGVLK